MDSSTAFYHEDGRGNIYDEEGNDATTFNEAPSFRLKVNRSQKTCEKQHLFGIAINRRG